MAATRSGVTRNIATARRTTPRYIAVARALAEGIAEGKHPVGSTLPTEHEICQTFSISRYTAREALRQLGEAGLVTRRPRTGTLVVSRQSSRPFVQTLATLEDLLQYAADTVLNITEIGHTTIDPDLAEETGLTPGETWIHVVGIRYRPEEPQPLSLTHVYINPSFEGIEHQLAESRGAIYKLLEHWGGALVDRVEQQISAVSVGREAGELLEVESGTPALRVVRLYYDRDNRMMEAAVSLHRGGLFSYYSTIRKQSQL